MGIRVMGVAYDSSDEATSFQSMVCRSEYANAVFLLHESWTSMLFSTKNGGGTASLREWTWPLCKGTPRAVGIPTGWCEAAGGFDSLVPCVKNVINLSIKRVVAHLIEHPQITTVIYSADPTDTGMIGVGIFRRTLGEDVRSYISTIIHDIPRLYALAREDPDYMTKEQIRDEEVKAQVPAIMFAEVLRGRAILEHKRKKSMDASAAQSKPASKTKMIRQKDEAKRKKGNVEGS